MNRRINYLDLCRPLSVGSTLVLALSVVLFGSGVSFSYAADQGFERIILVTIDTLRADRLGTYGYRRTTSPFLDSLAEKGVLFENAFAQSSHTQTAHASLFTSLLPYQHGVMSNDDAFGEGVYTMARMFSEQGYQSAGFVSIRFLEGLKEGFQHFDQASDRWEIYSNARQTTNAVLAWLLEEKPVGKLFLWVHYWDPHAWGGRKLEYQPKVPSSYYEKMKFASREKQDQFMQYLIDEKKIPLEYYRHDPERYMLGMNAYDAQILFVDHELQRLFNAMAATGLNEKALWIITSDHGEGLGNHDYYEHSKYIYQEQLHVPLIVFTPQKRYPSGRITQLVRHVDILPTLADVIRVSLRGASAEGVSLVPLLERKEQALAPIQYSFAQRRARDADAVKGGKRRRWEAGDIFSIHNLSHKYIYHSRGKDEFFDLVKDPFELENLIDVESETKDEMYSVLKGLAPKVAAVNRRKRKKPDWRIMKQLKSLGYM